MLTARGMQRCIGPFPISSNALYAVVVLVAKWCLTLCNPMDSGPPGSSVRGILQTRIPKCVAISFSRGSSWPRGRTHISCFGKWILYHWATQYALANLSPRSSPWLLKLDKETSEKGRGWNRRERPSEFCGTSSIELVFFLFFFFSVLCSLWNSSFLTTEWTCALGKENVGS